MENTLSLFSLSFSNKLSEFWSWAKETFKSEYYSEIENYLAQSSDIGDLEHRMKLLRQRGVL